MPSLVRIKIECAKDLPIMDRNSQSDASTDAFVEVKLDSNTQRTSTYRKSLNPVWNSEFRFEVIDDSVLQDAPVELRVMDQDIYSSELIGVVYVDLNPLIMRTAHSSNNRDPLVISGWFPIFDTREGMRGSLKITLKLQFIGNDNQFQDSSAGVQFFSASQLSTSSFVIQEVIGFVVDLVVEDDPESSWQDYFRNAVKSSNDSRLKVLYNLSAEVRREVGKKVLECGGNAVLGYTAHFDIESSIVARAYGTACRLLKVSDSKTTNILLSASTAVLPYPTASSWHHPNNHYYSSPLHHGLGFMVEIPDQTTLMQPELLQEFINNSTAMMRNFPTLRIPKYDASYKLFLASRQLSVSAGIVGSGGDDVDGSYGYNININNIGKIPNSVLEGNIELRQLINFGPSYEKTGGQQVALRAAGGVSGGITGGGGGDRSSVVVTNDMFSSEIKLLSLVNFGRNVRIRLGGLVMARSVKYLGKLEAKLSDQETREGWWEELRNEIRNHAKVLCCTHIIGYVENCTAFGDICVLSAFGTAATVRYLSHPIGKISRTGYHSGSAGEEDEEDVAHNPTNANVGLLSARDKELHRGLSSHRKGTVVTHARSRNATETSTASRSSQRYNMPESIRLRRRSSNSSVESLNSVAHSNAEVKTNDEKKDNMISKSPKQATATTSTSAGDHMSVSENSDTHALSPVDNKDSVDNDEPDNQPASLRLHRAHREAKACATAHVPYNHNTAPFGFMRLVPCLCCRRKWVPENVLATIEPSPALATRGKGVLLEARVCRTRKSGTGEADAVKVSDVLPFVEFDLQRQIMLKLKILGMNAAFGFQSKIQIGTNLVIATSVCTAVYLEALPPPPPMQVCRSIKSNTINGSDEARLTKLAREVESLAMMNKSLLDEAHQQLVAAKKGFHSHRDRKHRRTSLPPAVKYGIQSMSGDNQDQPTTGRSRSSTAGGSSNEDGEEKTGESESESSSSSATSTTATDSSSDVNNNDESSLESPTTVSSSSSESETSGTSSSSSESGETESVSDEEQNIESVKKSSEPTGAADPDPDADVVGKDADPNIAPAENSDVHLTEPIPKHSRPGARIRRTSIRSAELSEEKSPQATKVKESRSRHNTTTAMVNLPPNKVSKSVPGNALTRKAKRNLFRDERPPFLLEVDEETDADIAAVLADWEAPIGMDMVNTPYVPGSQCIPGDKGTFVVVFQRGQIQHSSSGAISMNMNGGAAGGAGNSKRLTKSKVAAQSSHLTDGSITTSGPLSPLLDKLFKQAYLRMCYSLRARTPCQILGVNHSVNLLDEDTVEIVITAMVHNACKPVLPISRGSTTAPVTARAARSSSHDSACSTNSALDYIVNSSATPTTETVSSSNNTNVAAGVIVGGAAGGAVNGTASRKLDTIEEVSGGGPASPTSTSSSPLMGSKLRISASQSFGAASASGGGGGVPRGRSNSGLNVVVTSSPTASVACGMPFFPPMPPPVQHQFSSTSSLGISRAQSQDMPSNTLLGSPSGGGGGGHFNADGTSNIILTPLSEIPDVVIKKYLGPLQLHFIKDTWTGSGRDGAVPLDTFFHLFITEVNAIARSQVVALGGNALICHRLVLQESGGKLYRNQSYNLISITGDVVLYEPISSLSSVPEDLELAVPTIITGRRDTIVKDKKPTIATDVDNRR